MLASLELFGFKSFAERTSFEFDPGVTAVVGPNGSGKSNVVDAIKWVLGDQSAKSLRGKEMTDVIFNGASGRKPSNFAEATLAFDNATGFLPTSDVHVRVGRRLWRNGDSEYLLNDQVVRLKDVRDLFMGTGAGSSAYAIIEQGRVDQVLQANAIGRRAVFEEAAGISRYKAKKNEALRRLERVEQNLLRLTDIVDEVEAQLHATRTQAAKAAAHRDATKELERWWLGMAADDYRYASAQLTTLRETLGDRQTELAACQTEQTELDGQVAGLDAEIASIDGKLRVAERDASRTRETIAGHEAARRYQTTRLDELSHDLGRLRRQVTLLSSRANEGHHEQIHNTRVLAATRDDIAQRRNALAGREAELEKFTAEIEALRGRIAESHDRQLGRMRGTAEAESRIAALAAERDGLRIAIESLDGRLGTVLVELVAAAEALDDEQAALDEAEAVVRVRQGRATDLRAARERLAAERETLVARVATLREQKSATAARIAVLEDLQNRGEGFGIGVREILRRARSLGDAPWNQIHGTVADLLDVDLDDAPLLEIALGDRAQLVVIETFDALLPYLGRSSAKIAGRVGFLSNQGLPDSVENDLAGIRYIEAYPPDRGSSDGSLNNTDPFAMASELIDPREIRGSLQDLPGVVKRADELIRSTSRMPHLARRLLHDTWIVTDLATALALAAGHGRGQRFVTQSGELLDADGTLVVGTLRAESAVVSRRSELIRLRSELIERDGTIAELLEQQTTLEDSQSALTRTLSAADAELREAIDQLNLARSAQSQAEARRGRHENDRVRLEQELVARQEDRASLDERIAAARLEKAATHAELARLKAELEQEQQGLGEIEQRQSECEAMFAAERLELAKADERLAALTDAVGRLERDGQQRAAQRSEAIRRLDSALVKHAETTCHLLNTQALHAEEFLERDRHESAIRSAAVARDELKGQRGRFSTRESALAAQRRSLGDSLHGIELEIREHEHQLASVAERIREEYGRELPELGASERSAISAWIEDREGEKSVSSFLLPPYAEIRPEIEARVERMRKKLRLMGAVNADSLADLEELEERHTRLSGQLQDLVEAKRTLEDLIRRINSESRRLFLETFESIREHFKELFRKLFGGGEGDIVLEDARDVLDCGIDIVARPPGKELRSLSLLSGGEKTMTCVGLLLAIFRSKPSPFCLLDEVDAALDEANIGRFVGVLKEFKSTTQFIMITHRKPSMCEADVLYGVTMEQAGVSKRLNVRFDDIAEDGNFRGASRRRAA